MAGENDVVVADGVGEEVASVIGTQAKDDLGAAEIVLVLVAKEFSFSNETALHIS